MWEFLPHHFRFAAADSLRLLEVPNGGFPSDFSWCNKVGTPQQLVMPCKMPGFFQMRAALKCQKVGKRYISEKGRSVKTPSCPYNVNHLCWCYASWSVLKKTLGLSVLAKDSRVAVLRRRLQWGFVAHLLHHWSCLFMEDHVGTWKIDRKYAESNR